MRTCSSLAVLLAATIPILTGCGGNPAPTVAPEPGARVRVTAPDVDGRRYDGTLVGLPADTIVVDTLRVAVASVTKFEVHRGRKSNARKGALIGGGVLGAGALDSQSCGSPGVANGLARTAGVKPVKPPRPSPELRRLPSVSARASVP